VNTPLRVVAYGGGVQSTALLVLAAHGYIPHRTFLFANVGDDSEHPDTLRYVREVAFDFAATHGIEIHELERTPKRGRHAGEPVTLRQAMLHPDSKSVPIPMRGENGAPGSRSCTVDYKVRVLNRWLTEHGATPENPAHVAIGISTDEISRANNAKREPNEVLEYPLLTIEHRLAPRGASRADCEAIIRDAGLPVPPKSSCYFCPFHRVTVWADLARTRPDLFEQAAQLEDHVNRHRAPGNRLYMTKFARPLRDVFATHTQGALFDDPAWFEDEGYRCGDVCDT
jgi:hypothetical protein